MAVQNGKDLLIKVDLTGTSNFVTVAGLRATRLAFNAETVDVTTLDGLAEEYSRKHRKPAGTLHPVQAAFIEHQATQCGYCINGWIMTAAAFLDRQPGASESEIRAALAGLKCRCGSHMGILRAVKSAAAAMTKAAT